MYKFFEIKIVQKEKGYIKYLSALSHLSHQVFLTDEIAFRCKYLIQPLCCNL